MTSCRRGCGSVLPYISASSRKDSASISLVVFRFMRASSSFRLGFLFLQLSYQISGRLSSNSQAGMIHNYPDGDLYLRRKMMEPIVETVQTNLQKQGKFSGKDVHIPSATLSPGLCHGLRMAHPGGQDAGADRSLSAGQDEAVHGLKPVKTSGIMPAVQALCPYAGLFPDPAETAFRGGPSCARR